MKTYHNLLGHVMTFGVDTMDRTGVGTRSVFGYMLRHRMADGFPLLTTKKIFVKAVIHELLWFLRGETNVRSLQAEGVTIWDEWADEFGELGPVYGKQWRSWWAIGENGSVFIDQIADLVRGLKENPFSRRHVVTAWNPADVPKMKLPPCHTLFQCNVQRVILPGGAIERRLNLMLFARSIDSFLGLPFNLASYGFLLEMLAHVCGYVAGELVIAFGDLHIYLNHFEQVKLQRAREPRPLPTLHFARQIATIDDFKYEDFVIEGYDPHPAIKAPVAV